jgi:hypothetical protein
LHAQEKDISFYVVAHQDDWQLFMGANVFNDIQNFSETGPFPNGKRVVIIHTTAGNLNDIDDSTPCDCRDPHDTSIKKVKYWKAREAGVKNSVHLAACRRGGWGPSFPYPKDETIVINGHSITKASFKNTVTYFLRTKTGMFDKWRNDENADVGTVDTSTTYLDWSDLVTTIYYIYKAEIDSISCKSLPEFNVTDIDNNTNPNDHPEHYQAGRAGFEAAQLLAKNAGTPYNVTLFMGYNSQNMPENIKEPDAQSEAGLAAAYCLALLDYNAWPEWGPLFYDWTSRNYYRTITTAQQAIANTNVCGQDSLTGAQAKIYPNPANKQLNIKINIPLKTNLDIQVMDASSKILYSASIPFDTHNTFIINTATYPNGSYLLTLESGGTKISGNIFQVVH